MEEANIFQLASGTRNCITSFFFRNGFAGAPNIRLKILQKCVWSVKPYFVLASLRFIPFFTTSTMMYFILFQSTYCVKGIPIYWAKICRVRSGDKYKSCATSSKEICRSIFSLMNCKTVWIRLSRRFTSDDAESGRMVSRMCDAMPFRLSIHVAVRY